MQAEKRNCAFITGVTGQDGFYLAELLLGKGYEVHGLVRRRNLAEGSTPEGVVLHRGDLSDTDSLRQALQAARPTELYNLAAQSNVVMSYSEPEYTADVDGLGTTRLLEICRELGLGTRFFQASSMQMFGKSAPPFNDDTPFRPTTPYGIAKLYAHLMCQSYRESYGMFVSCGTFFHHESPRRAPQFVCRKITHGVAAVVAGKASQLQLGNLAAECDWGDARDFVVGIWRALQHTESTCVAGFVWCAFASSHIRSVGTISSRRG